jgi:hypothetical protein
VFWFVMVRVKHIAQPVGGAAGDGSSRRVVALRRGPRPCGSRTTTLKAKVVMFWPKARIWRATSLGCLLLLWAESTG